MEISIHTNRMLLSENRDRGFDIQEDFFLFVGMCPGSWVSMYSVFMLLVGILRVVGDEFCLWEVWRVEGA
jgi:hypothetical protein